MVQYATTVNEMIIFEVVRDGLREAPFAIYMIVNPLKHSRLQYTCLCKRFGKQREAVTALRELAKRFGMVKLTDNGHPLSLHGIWDGVWYTDWAIKNIDLKNLPVYRW